MTLGAIQRLEPDRLAFGVGDAVNDVAGLHAFQTMALHFDGVSADCEIHCSPVPEETRPLGQPGKIAVSAAG
jgi:hypothetical protein